MEQCAISWDPWNHKQAVLRSAQFPLLLLTGVGPRLIFAQMFILDGATQDLMRTAASAAYDVRQDVLVGLRRLLEEFSEDLWPFRVLVSKRPLANPYVAAFKQACEMSVPRWSPTERLVEIRIYLVTNHRT